MPGGNLALEVFQARAINQKLAAKMELTARNRNMMNGGDCEHRKLLPGIMAEVLHCAVP
jgi:hypothetical protein